MKHRRPIALWIAAFMALSAIAGCGAGSPPGGAASENASAAATTAAATTTAAAAATTTKAADATTAAATTAAKGTTAAAATEAADGKDASPKERQAPKEGKDTNNGRPYNLSKVKYDSRQDKYLNGINATILPIVDELTEFTFWMPFSSTVLSNFNDCEVFKELEKRTNIRINWMHPPQGQSQDNFNLLISSGNLPHMFINPPAYPGGQGKAVEDEVYLDLTPYYEQGFMPNYRFLKESRPDLAPDMTDDAGRILTFHLIDIVPSSPWYGLWVRRDWCDDLNLPVPKTIDEWDTMLYAMQSEKTPHPLYFRLVDMGTTYAFVSSFEAAYNYFNKDGKVTYGPSTEGYRQFLTLMNKWYKDGILDPDLSVRTPEDRDANIMNGKTGAFDMAYGNVGPYKLAGKANDPNFKIQATLMPTSYPGQQIHMHQHDSIVRVNREYVTPRAVEDGVIEILLRYKDYWFSQDGGDLASYGPEGVSYRWTEDGVIEWIYPDLVNVPDADFWTLYPRFKVHAGPMYLRDSTAYDNADEVWECIETWASQDASWVMPDFISYKTDESKELAALEADINTYREEMTFRFIMGQTPISEFDGFVEQLNKLGVNRVIEIRQAALERYKNR